MLFIVLRTFLRLTVLCAVLVQTVFIVIHVLTFNSLIFVVAAAAAFHSGFVFFHFHLYILYTNSYVLCLQPTYIWNIFLNHHGNHGESEETAKHFNPYLFIRHFNVFINVLCFCVNSLVSYCAKGTSDIIFMWLSTMVWYLNVYNLIETDMPIYLRIYSIKIAW